MNFIIIILILILFNIIVFMFTDKNVSNKIISNFYQNNDCPINNMILTEPHSHLECLNRCTVLKKEYENTDNCNCEELCIETKDDSSKNLINIQPIVKYTQIEKNKINIKWLIDSFVDENIILFDEEYENKCEPDEEGYVQLGLTDEQKKKYFSDIKPIPLTTELYDNYKKEPDKYKISFWKANYIPNCGFKGYNDDFILNEGHPNLILIGDYAFTDFLGKTNADESTFIFKGWFPNLKYIGLKAFLFGKEENKKQLSDVSDKKLKGEINLSRLYSLDFMKSPSDEAQGLDVAVPTPQNAFDCIFEHEGKAVRRKTTGTAYCPAESGGFDNKIKLSFDNYINEDEVIEFNGNKFFSKEGTNNQKKINFDIREYKKFLEDNFKTDYQNKILTKRCSTNSYPDYDDINNMPEWCFKGEINFNNKIQSNIFTNNKWSWIIEYSPRDSNYVIKKNLGTTEKLKDISINQGINIEEDIISFKEYIFVLYAKKLDGSIIKSPPQIIYVK